MSVDPTTGTIFVSKSKLPGTYYLKVTGSLPDYVTNSFDVFTITVLLPIPINYPPLFSTSLSDTTVPLMTSSIYTFPSITDQNSGDSPNI
jgi:hypothetical protein